MSIVTVGVFFSLFSVYLIQDIFNKLINAKYLFKDISLSENIFSYFRNVCSTLYVVTTLLNRLCETVQMVVTAYTYEKA